MPKKETLRKYYPDCNLPDEKMMKIAEWLRVHLNQEHISPTNKLLKVLITWENTNKRLLFTEAERSLIFSALDGPLQSEDNEVKTTADKIYAKLTGHKG